MYISPQVVTEIARSTAPQVAEYVLPMLAEHPSVILFLLTLSSFLTKYGSLWSEFTKFTDPTDKMNLRVQKVFDLMGSADLFVLKSLFHDSEFSGEDCLLSAACLMGESRHISPVERFLFTKFFDGFENRDCTGSSNQQLFCKFEKTLIKATIEGKSFCEKQKFKCSINSVENFISKLKVKVANTEKNPIQARSESPNNLVDYFYEIINSS